MFALIVIAAVCGFYVLAGCMIVQQEKKNYLSRQYTASDRGAFQSQSLQALSFETSQET